MIAHIGAIPLEEVLPSAAGALVAARAWLTFRLRGRR